MKFWLESLQENAYDVFTTVIIIVSIIAYHYLQRWYLHKQLNEIKDNLLEIIEEICDRC